MYWDSNNNFREKMLMSTLAKDSISFTFGSNTLGLDTCFLIIFWIKERDLILGFQPRISRLKLSKFPKGPLSYISMESKKLDRVDCGVYILKIQCK